MAVIKPMIRSNICINAHPIGCAKETENQINYVKSQKAKRGTKTIAEGGKGPKTVLVIGCSTGYGLASRIAAAFEYGADTIGVSFEKEATETKGGTPGFYNNKAFDKFAAAEGLKSVTYNADAFADETRETIIAKIKEWNTKVDLIIYSLASPVRTDPDTKVLYKSVIKPINQVYAGAALDMMTGKITQASTEPAVGDDIPNTVKVMGGEDWADWIDALKDADVLTENAVTVAYSYIGPELTYPIYYHGTIGTAKQHLQKTMSGINQAHPDVRAVISVNKGLVTQASAAIPVVPLYFAILYKVMKKAGTHENCIQQIARLFTQKLYTPTGFQTDENGFIRMDDHELTPEIQEEVKKCWKAVTTDTVKKYCDIDGYWEDFYHMFGFHYEDIDYTRDVDADVEIDGIVM